MKFLFVFFGLLLEIFLSQLGNLFQISGREKDKINDDFDYKYRRKLSKYKIPVLSFMSIWDKYLFYAAVYILKTVVTRVLQYAVKIEKATELDQRLIKIYMNLMIICLTFTIYDIFLFGSRNLLH